MLFLLGFSAGIMATDYYIDNNNNNGNGTLANPFNNFNDALSAAGPGDVIWVMEGTYNLGSELETVRSGTANNRITIRAYNDSQRPVLRRTARVASIEHQYITLRSLIFDGQWGERDVIRVRSGGDHLIIKNCVVRNGKRDGIDIASADNVLIEDCVIHHMLNGSFNNQQDAHGIVATGQQNLTIRGCNIYYVTGDCFQTDPNRGYPLWDNVLIENCTMWTGPLPADAAEWNAGQIPGENAVDTKINEDEVSSGYRPRITIRNVTAYGFEPGYITNRAAFNIKEQVECTMENILAYNNEIAFRLRGPGSRGGAHVTIINAIAYDNVKVFRAEDDIEELKIYNSTFDNSSGGRYFQNAGGGYEQSSFDMRNCLFVGSKPSDASHSSNLSADAGFFQNMANNDYHLTWNSAAIDAGETIAIVTTDYDGNTRYSGSYDIGAFEYDSATGIDPEAPLAIGDFQLGDNYPNPFNPETQIPLTVNRSGPVQLVIYNVLGQRVRELLNRTLETGSYRFTWDGLDDRGNPMTSGIYLYRLESGKTAQAVKTMHLIR